MGPQNGGSRPRCGDAQSIDIRDLQRRALLRTGSSGISKWFCNDEPTGSMSFTVYTDAITFSYAFRPITATRWNEVRQRIALTWTACAFGGHRPWFRCGCGRRVAILYRCGELFRCRQCCGLAYACQLEGPIERGLRRAQSIRRRLQGLQGNPNVFSSFPTKPRGLHWRTYAGLRARGIIADRQVKDLLAAYLKRLQTKQTRRSATAARDQQAAHSYLDPEWRRCAGCGRRNIYCSCPAWLGAATAKRAAWAASASSVLLSGRPLG